MSAPLLHKQPERAAAAAGRLRDLFGPGRLWIELQHHCLPDDDRLASGLLALAGRLGLPCVITNDVHYATRDYSRLRDALIAIDHNQSLPEARRAGRLPLNSTYALAPPGDLERRFACLPPGARAAACAPAWRSPRAARSRWTSRAGGCRTSRRRTGKANSPACTSCATTTWPGASPRSPRPC